MSKAYADHSEPHCHEKNQSNSQLNPTLSKFNEKERKNLQEATRMTEIATIRSFFMLLKLPFYIKLAQSALSRIEH